MPRRTGLARCLTYYSFRWVQPLREPRPESIPVPPNPVRLRLEFAWNNPEPPQKGLKVRKKA